MINAKQYNKQYGAFYIIYFDATKGYWVNHKQANGNRAYLTYGRARSEARKLTREYPNVKVQAYNKTSDCVDSLDF